MSIKNEYKVMSIKKAETYEWLLKKHYAHRLPPISYAFGLYNQEKILIGVCTFGVPASPKLKESCGDEWSKKFFELNRLCIDEGLPKNTCSFFISRCLSLLPKPRVIVSYADSSQNHHGYIYQATNWVYTGMSLEIDDYKVVGLEHLNQVSLLDSVGRNDNGKGYGKSKIERMKEKYGDKLYKEARPRKHRYFMFLGSKKQIKTMRKSLKYKSEPYPKGDNKRYDASYEPSTQGLFNF
jgi:hypothetical protein